MSQKNLLTDYPWFIAFVVFYIIGTLISNVLFPAQTIDYTSITERIGFSSLVGVVAAYIVYNYT